MPIINFTFDHDRIPADAVNVRESTEQNRSYWLYDSHVGLCIADYERNGYDDSDFYMTVWNVETQEPQDICFASTRGWTYPSYGSRPDATPEVKAAYDAYMQERARVARAEREAREATRPGKGKLLRVVRGRKIPVGTEGVCFWFGDTRFGVRVGIKTDDGQTHFTAVTNVEAIPAAL